MCSDHSSHLLKGSNIVIPFEVLMVHICMGKYKGTLMIVMGCVALIVWIILVEEGRCVVNFITIDMIEFSILCSVN